LSDQKEKPNGALPKGYDANTSSTEVVKQKKINFLELVRYTSTDQDQREKDLKEYEANYIARLEKNEPEESSDDFRVELGVSTESDDDLGKLTISTITTALNKLRAERAEYEKQYLVRYSKQRKAKPKKKVASSDLYKPEIPKPKRDMKKERKKYEQKYLSRYTQPKSGVKKSTSWTQHDVALGRLTLSTHFNAKRRAKQNEIREYEKQYLSRYKQPKSGVKKSSNLKHDTDLGTLTLRQNVNAKRKTKQDEIREYEKQYLSRYKEPKPKKRAIQLEWEPEPKPKPKPKRDMRKERKDYENEFLTRYRKQEKAKPKKRAIQLEWEPEPKQDIRKERKDYERKYVSKFTKLQKTKLKIAALEQKLRLSQIELEEPKADRKKERKEYEKELLTRYKKQQKAKPKKNTSKLLTPEPKTDRKKERKD